jgi:hypothetical protein
MSCRHCRRKKSFITSAEGVESDEDGEDQAPVVLSGRRLVAVAVDDVADVEHRRTTG